MTPASRVLVLIVPAHATGTVPVYEAITNAQGEWSYGSIPAGEYSVAMIVVEADGTNDTRLSKIVELQEGEALSLGTLTIGAPAVSEARTHSEILAEGTLMVQTKTAEGLPANDAVLTIDGEESGGTFMTPLDGFFTLPLRNGPVTVSATDTPPDSASQVSATAHGVVVAGSTTAIELVLPSVPPLAVPAGVEPSYSERDLTYLNAERARWGLPAGVTLDLNWSQACAAHDLYMADNHVVEHPEDSSLPGASPGGAWAGLSSILAGGPDWLPEANPWEDAPIHLDQLYTPDLAVVGIDESRERTCTTTWPGIGPPRQPAGTITTYPGEGAGGFPPSEQARELPFVPGKFVGLPEGTVTGRELFVYEERGTCGLFCPSQVAPAIESASLSGPQGPVEVRSVSGDTPEIGSYLSGAIVIPVKPLAPNATYTAEVTLAAYGDLPAEHHRWAFRTGPPNAYGEWPGRPVHASSEPSAVSGLTITPSRFAVTGRRHRDSGATVSYQAPEAGTRMFVVYRLEHGVITRGRICRAHTREGTKGRPCSLDRWTYAIRHRDAVGRNSFRLTGHYGHHVLSPGEYRLVASPTAAADFTVTR